MTRTGRSAETRSREIIIVSPFALPERGANSLRVHSLADYLIRNNISTKIFAPVRGVKSEGIVERYSSVIELMGWIFRSRADAVFYTSPPITHALFAGFAAKLSGKKFFADLRDPWPKSYELQGIYRSGSLKLVLFKLAEQIAYILADKIFVVTTGIAQHVSKRGFESKIVYAPNGTTPGFNLSLKNRAIVRKKFGILQNDVVFVFSGSFTGWGIDELIKGFRSFPKNYKLLLLVPEANVNNNSYLETKKSAELLLGKRLISFDISGLAPSKVSEYLSAADVGISIIHEKLGYCIVAKTYDYIATGLFVLAKGPSAGSLKDLMKEYSFGQYNSSWEEFFAFRAKLDDISLEEKHARVDLAHTKFARDNTNEIIFNAIFGCK